MKKSLIASILSAGLTLPIAVLAQVPVAIGTFGALIEKIKIALWAVFGIFVLVAFVIAGIKFLTAQGKAESITEARTAFVWGVVGIVVGILAYSILAIVTTMLS